MVMHILPPPSPLSFHGSWVALPAIVAQVVASGRGVKVAIRASRFQIAPNRYLDSRAFEGVSGA